MDRVERGVVAAVLAKPELMPSVLARAELTEFKDGRARRVLEQCAELYDREGDIDHAELCAMLQDRELTALIADIATSELDRGKWEPWLQDCLSRLEARKRRRELTQLKERAATETTDVDREALSALFEHHRRRAGTRRDAGEELP